MKILLSPAKMLNYQKDTHPPFHSLPHFSKEADFLAKKLQQFSPKQLSDLMKVSMEIASINYQRFQEWKIPTTLSDTSLPAATVFNGEVYKGLKASAFTKKEAETAQEKIRILSGLYGILKPFDLMYPYRLEMGTKWQLDGKTPNLYSFWRNLITDFLNKELQKNEIIINLASKEYAKVMDTKKIKNRIITPVFKELRGDTFKTIMLYAKFERGAMAKELLKDNYHDIENLKSYDNNGYFFNEQLSSENEWVFVR